MIKSLYLEGFKSFGKPVQIDFRDITLLYGENSSGKSTVLQALQYAREVFCNENLDCLKTEIGGDFVNLKGFDNFVSGKQTENYVKIGVQVTPIRQHWKSDRTRRIDCGRTRSLLNMAISNALHPSMRFVLKMVSDAMHRGAKTNTTVLPTGCDVDTFGITVQIGYRSDSDIHVTAIWIYINESLVLSIGQPDKTDSESVANYPLPVNAVNIFYNHAVFPGDYNDLYSHIEGNPGKYGDSLNGWQQRLDALELSRNGVLHFLDHENEQLEWLLDRDADGPYNWLDELYWRLIGHNDIDPSEIPADQRKDIAVAMFFAFASFSASAQVVREALDTMLYVGPLRSHYTVDESAKPATQKQRADAWANGIGAWHQLEDADTFYFQSVNDWLQHSDRFGFDCTVSNTESRISDFAGKLDASELPAFRALMSEVALPKRVLLLTRGGIMLNSTDLGVGFSQVLPVIVAAIGPTEGSCILLEQPELHIHARLQAVLGDLIATGRANRQFVIETHSEFLLLRLMRRIRETTKELPSDGPRLLCDSVAVYHVEKVDGCSQVKKIELDTYGNLTAEWPDDLFDLSFKERFGE